MQLLNTTTSLTDSVKIASWIALCIGADLCIDHDMIARDVDMRYDIIFNLQKRRAVKDMTSSEYFYRVCKGFYPRVEIVKSLQTQKNIFIITAKNKWNDKIIYDNLILSLRELADKCQENSVQYLSMPMLGCNSIDGLDWTVVEQAIINAFKDTNIEITIHSYDPTYGKTPEQIFKPHVLTKDVHAEIHRIDLTRHTFAEEMQRPDGYWWTDGNHHNKPFPDNSKGYRRDVVKINDGLPYVECTIDPEGPYAQNIEINENKSCGIDSEYIHAIKCDMRRKQERYYQDRNTIPTIKEYIEYAQSPANGSNYYNYDPLAEHAKTALNASSHAYMTEEMLDPKNIRPNFIGHDCNNKSSSLNRTDIHGESDTHKFVPAHEFAHHRVNPNTGMTEEFAQKQQQQYVLESLAHSHLDSLPSQYTGPHVTDNIPHVDHTPHICNTVAPDSEAPQECSLPNRHNP